MKHNSIKKLLVWLLCACMLAGTFSLLATADSLPRSISVQNGTGTRGAVAVAGSYSYRAMLNGSFDGFGYCLPTYNTTDAECTVSMYKWEGSFDATVAKQPIASQRFTAMKDNATNWVRFDAQPAGEYLFHISEVKGQVGVWTNNNPKDSKGFLYLNGVEQRGEPELYFNFENDNVPEEPFGTCEPSTDVIYRIAPYTNPVNKLPGNVAISSGMRLSLNAAFAGVEFEMATYTEPDLMINMSVYAWQGTYAKTVEQAPLVDERILLIDNAMQGITFDKLPAGDYLFLLHNASKSPAVYVYSEVTGFEGYVYKDGFPAAGTLQYPNMQVLFAEEAANGDYFAQCDEPEDTIDGNYTTPDEYVIPEDSLIYTHPVMPDTWVFTDGLGRTSLTYADVGAPRDGKTVAMFYWTWHIGGGFTSSLPVNLQQVCEQHPEAIRDFNHEIWKDTSSYWWNESIYGYYKTDDAWVLRKQAELLTNAGVDVIFTDNTNGDLTWNVSYNALLKEWDDAMQDGLKTPKLSFMFPFWDESYTNIQLSAIYQDVYRADRYRNLWYYRNGKPMVMAMPSSFDPNNSPVEKEISNFFTFRPGQPGYVVDHTDYGTWGWLSMYPQAVYYESAKDQTNGIVDQITVGVAMNHDYKVGDLAAMSGNNIAGRSYTSNYKDRYDKEGDEASKWGYNFAEQWNYALEVDPSVVFVTGWNEFRVGRYEEWPEDTATSVPNAFPDQFNDEFSRDIEPTKGALKDHYYYQLVNFVRRYKGCNPIPTPSDKVTIDLAAGQEQWKTVEPYFGAYIGNTEHRDALGYGSVHLTETSGRNDIIGAQIARDDEYVYFNVECAADITPYTDSLWMTLYIDSNQQNQGWETFEYVVGKSAASADTVVLEKFTGNGYETTKVADCAYTVNGRYMTVKIAKSDLGLSGDGFTINFSWTDNVHDEGDYTKFSGDIMDFYISGDVAPGARFKFSYVCAKAAEGEDTTDDQTTAPDSAEQTTAPDSTEQDEQPSGCKSAAFGALAAVAAAAAAAVALKKKD